MKSVPRNQPTGESSQVASVANLPRSTGNAASAPVSQDESIVTREISLASPTIHPRERRKFANQVARELRKLLEEFPDVYACQIEGNNHPKVEAWQFVAACYGCTPKVSRTVEEVAEYNLGFSAVADLLNAEGRAISSAESSCMRSEPEWNQKPEFQLRSMAQMRACSRTCRNIFAWIMPLAGLSPTPAEEITKDSQGFGQSPSHSKLSGKKCYDCQNKVSNALAKKTREEFGRVLCVECKSKSAKPSAQTQQESEPSLVPSHAEIEPGKKQPVMELLDNMPKRSDAWSV